MQTPFLVTPLGVVTIVAALIVVCGVVVAVSAWLGRRREMTGGAELVIRGSFAAWGSFLSSWRRNLAGLLSLIVVLGAAVLFNRLGVLSTGIIVLLGVLVFMFGGVFLYIATLRVIVTDTAVVLRNWYGSARISRGPEMVVMRRKDPFGRPSHNYTLRNQEHAGALILNDGYFAERDLDAVFHAVGARQVTEKEWNQLHFSAEPQIARRIRGRFWLEIIGAVLAPFVVVAIVLVVQGIAVAASSGPAGPDSADLHPSQKIVQSQTTLMANVTKSLGGAWDQPNRANTACKDGVDTSLSSVRSLTESDRQLSTDELADKVADAEQQAGLVGFTYDNEDKTVVSVGAAKPNAKGDPSGDLHNPPLRVEINKKIGDITVELDSGCERADSR